MAEKPPHGISTQELSPLPDLDTKYTVIKQLGSGANDTGYLIRGQSGLAVVLVPRYHGDRSSPLSKIQSKFELASTLSEHGMGKFLVRLTETGMMTVDGLKEVVAVVEYGGTSVEELIKKTDIAAEKKKLSVLKQMWEFTILLHSSGRYNGDFKLDHFLFDTDLDGKTVVKVIDYTLFPEASSGPDYNADYHKNDVRNILYVLRNFFPWFDASKFRTRRDSTIEEVHRQFEELLIKLEQASNELSPRQKTVRSIQLTLRRVLKGLTARSLGLGG